MIATRIAGSIGLLLGIGLAAGGAAQAQEGARSWSHGAHAPNAAAPASATWNDLAREAAAAAAQYAHTGHGGPAMGGRAYALLSLAQLAASEGTEGPAERLAVATASWAVLAELFPQAGARIDERLHAERELALAEGVDVVQAEAHGQIAAADVLNWSAADGHDLPWTGSLRLGADSWVSAPGAEPIGTNWGAVRPWLVESSGQFRPAAPPAVGSPEFEQALDEVRRVSRDRTPEQLALALKWMHPVDGYWNEVAAGLTREAGLSDEATARMLTLMNAAIVDAVATCFDTKYEYQYPRPSHIDGSISMAVPLPNHPSFVSGHACVSGAASAVLSHFFPTKAPELLATAEEIALSRLYAGVHYRFDNEVGLSIGRAIAKHAIDLDPSSEDVLGR